MTDVVLDYSAARPDPALIKQHAVGVMRYLGDGSLAGSYNLTAHERDALFDAGLAIGLVWETSASRMNGGFLAGYADAVVANRQADDLEHRGPIYFANDQNTQGDDRHFAYMAGAQHISRREVGAYGSTAFLKACAELGIRYRWKVSTWGPQMSGLTLEQMANIPPPIAGTDVNHVRADDWGQWEKELAVMPTGADVIASGLKYRGIPYSTAAGRTDPASSGHADCSGFVVAALRDVGVNTGSNTVSTSLETWAVQNGGRYIDRDEARATPGAGIAIWGYGSGGHIGFSVGNGSQAFETPSDEGRRVGYSRFDRNRWGRFFTIPGIDHHGSGVHLEEDDDMGFLAHINFDERVWYCRAGVRTVLNTSSQDLDINILAQLAQAGAVPDPVDIRLIGPGTLKLFRSQQADAEI